MPTVLITGASRGIGRAAAIRFARGGYNIVINFNTSEKEAKALAAEITAMGARAVPFKADIAKAEELDAMFAYIKAVFGGADVLVNNAGISKSGFFADMTDSFDAELMSVNFLGITAVTRRALPYMLTNHGGSIVNVASMWGITGASCEAVYSASKAAVIGFTKSLAKELGPSGIRVNAVAPGVINSDMNAHLTKEDIAALKDNTPLCRIGTPGEAAEAIFFLAGGQASFITGAVLAVDGGFTA